MEIRPLKKSDLPAIQLVIASTELFPAELLDEMTKPYFSAASSDEHWIVALHTNEPVAVAYFKPEALTDGTFNLLAIAVRSDLQGKGIGSSLIAFVENWLRKEGQRLLLIETSGLPEYAQTRKFYINLGYSLEAKIRNYYRDGEDKITYVKSLNME